MKTLVLVLLLSIFGNCANSLPKHQLYEHARISLVKLSYTEEHDGTLGTYYCTGFIVDAAKGWAVTAKHCLPDNKETQFFINDGIPAEVVKTSDTLAMIKIPVMMGPPMELAKDSELTQDLTLIGYGYGGWKVLIRHIASYDDDDIYVDAPIVPGMSGGPMLDDDGHVVALIQATAPAIGLGCGYKELKKFIKP